MYIYIYIYIKRERERKNIKKRRCSYIQLRNRVVKMKKRKRGDSTFGVASKDLLKVFNAHTIFFSPPLFHPANGGNLLKHRHGSNLMEKSRGGKEGGNSSFFLHCT